MALLVPDVGEVVLLNNLLAGGALEDWTLKLYSSNTTPAESDTDATYTEATFTGYATKTLTRAIGAGNWSTPATATGTTSSSYAMQSYSATSAQTIYGYFIVGATSTTLLVAERFATEVSLVNPSTLELTPQLELG